jgi:phage terminase small subunit
MVLTPRGADARLMPPKHLPERAREVFVDLVLANRPDFFTPSDLPLLCRYAEATEMAERAAGAMAKTPIVDGKPSPWIAIHGQMTKAMSALSMRLRLSPQARQPNRPTRPVETSYYDRMRMRLEADDDRDRQASAAASDQAGLRGEPGERWTD